MNNLTEEVAVLVEKNASDEVQHAQEVTLPRTPLSEGKSKLKQWLNKNFRIEMTDGRILTGIFLCTDRDANVILGSCSEYLKAESDEEPRVLGLVMVPGRHIVSIQLDDTITPAEYNTTPAKVYSEEHSFDSEKSTGNFVG